MTKSVTNNSYKDFNDDNDQIENLQNNFMEILDESFTNNENFTKMENKLEKSFMKSKTLNIRKNSNDLNKSVNKNEVDRTTINSTNDLQKFQNYDETLTIRKAKSNMIIKKSEKNNLRKDLSYSTEIFNEKYQDQDLASHYNFISIK